MLNEAVAFVKGARKITIMTKTSNLFWLDDDREEAISIVLNPFKAKKPQL